MVSVLGDKGLLDMILDSNFAVTRQIYIYYSRNSNPCVVALLELIVPSEVPKSA